MTRSAKIPRLKEKPASAWTPEGWFSQRGWSPFPFQQEVWDAYRQGESGLVHSSTGTGKTYAAFFGPVLEAIEWEKEAQAPRDPSLRVLWITPLRALSADTARSLSAPLEATDLRWKVGVRTGDTSSTTRRKQKDQLPEVLVTTPESLSLLLTYPGAEERFASLQCVVCDEWHELVGSKRGVLTELALARLRRWAPRLRTWGLSATLADLAGSLESLLGLRERGRIVQGNLPKPIVIDSLLPARIERFPWAGHMGLSLLPAVLEALDAARTSLVFTNTRNQAEIWFQALLEARPAWSAELAIHHGSLDRKARDEVEQRLSDGSLRCVVCTSTLDLGVDFAPVERVLQIGSPKGIGRLLQRAGRSGHQPGEQSRVTCVPTHILELAEVAAARSAASLGHIESRPAIEAPIDVLVQHLVSSALGDGFREEELLEEVRSTRAFHELDDHDWQWALDFVTRGGKALNAYPEYRRVEKGEDSVYRVQDAQIAQRQRWSIGTIVSDALVDVRYMKGGKLGTVEESFVSRLQPGDRFSFAGRTLEFVRLYQMTAYVKRTKLPASVAPRWAGSRLPLSTELAESVRQKLHQSIEETELEPELAALRPIVELQKRWSYLPSDKELLVEVLESREGHHLYVYPFEGWLVHEAMATLFAYRYARQAPQTLALSVNDYGFEIASTRPIELEDRELKDFLSPHDLDRDIVLSLNAGELTRRHFREIARVAGLVTTGLPRAGKSAKQMQASSGLFYDVFKQYDPDNLLLRQAEREVLWRSFDLPRLRRSLERIARADIRQARVRRPTPLAFSLWVDRMRQRVSSEDLATRVRRLVAELEREAGPA